MWLSYSNWTVYVKYLSLDQLDKSYVGTKALEELLLGIFPNQLARAPRWRMVLRQADRDKVWPD